MAGNWNPNAPGVLGLEWRGFYPFIDKRTSSPFKAMRMPSTVTETIDALYFGIGPTTNTTAPNFRMWEVFREEDVVIDPTGAGFERYVPNAHGTGTGIGNWRTQAGSATNIHLSIDDVVKYPPVGTDYIRNITTISNAFFHFNSSAFSLTRRVGRLRFRGVTSTGGAHRDIYFRLWHVPSGTLFVPPGDRVRTHYYGLLHEVDLGEINPVTLLPWSPTDVRGFASANNVWQFRVTGGGSAANPVRLWNLELEVQYYSPENRVAVGTYDRPNGEITGGLSGGQHMHKFVETQALVEPDGAGGWATNWHKVAGEDYVYVFRAAQDRLVSGIAARSDDLRLSFVGGEDRDGRMPPPVPGMRSGPVIFGSTTSLIAGGIGKAGPFTDTPVAAIAPLITGVGTNASNDSQPYVVRHEKLVPVNAVVDEDQAELQVFVAPATETYLGVRFVIKPPADGVGTLRVTVHSWNGIDPTISDTQVGGKLDVKADELLETAVLPNMPGFREVRGVLETAAPLVSGTDYYVKFVKLSGTAGTKWELRRLWSNNADEATFQGSDGVLVEFNPLTGTDVFRSAEDLGVQLYRQPDPPQNVVVERLTQVRDLTDPTCVTDQSCVVPTIDYAELTWGTPGTYGSDFDRWEIQRQEPDDTWVDVGTSHSETIRFFTDYEALRNQAVEYRVRAMLTTGAFSNWVESNQITPTSYGSEIVFASNVKPELNIAYTHDPDVPMEFLDHENDELMFIQGSDFRVAFLDPHDRGMSLAYRIAANFGAQPINAAGLPIAGERVFDPLRNITRGRGFVDTHTSMSEMEGHRATAFIALPYVCVLDYEGSRRFAYVRLSNGSRGMPFWRYWCTATVIPVTNMPTVLDVEGNMLVLDGASGTFASTPDHADFDITGDVTLMAELHLEQWTPSPIQTLVSKWNGVGNQRSYMLQMNEDGRWRMITTPDGTSASQTIFQCDISAGTLLDDTGRIALAAAVDVNVGGTNRECRFYAAPSIHGPWTLIDTHNIVGTTSVFSSTANLNVGAWENGTQERFNGHIVAARVLSGLIASTDQRAYVNFANVRPGSTTVPDTDDPGKIWSLQGTAEILPMTFFP